MRKLFLSAVLVLMTFLFAPSSLAQGVLPPAGTVRVDLPFDFLVSDTHLTAGTYLFFIDTQTSRLYIRNVDTGHTISVFTRDILTDDQPTANKLVFQQDASQHVLHKVWSSQAGHVHDIVHGTELIEPSK